MIRPKPSRLQRKLAQEDARITALLRRGEIRHDVIARARGLCENCGEPGAALDHWVGGRGRRTHEESIATCWLLCLRCHEARTLNTPSAAHWNHRFEQHARRHGYPYVPHLTRYELAFGPHRTGRTDPE